MEVPANSPDMIVDWSEISTTALGTEWASRSIYEVSVAHFDSMSLAEMEVEFLQLEDFASEQWRGDVLAGDDLSLNELRTEDGSAFEGISSEGTWLLALHCGTCGNPAPWFIAQLRACE